MDIKALAREAGIVVDRTICPGLVVGVITEGDLRRLVERIAKECVKVCEEYGAWNDTAQNIAEAIRDKFGG